MPCTSTCGWQEEGAWHGGGDSSSSSSSSLASCRPSAQSAQQCHQCRLRWSMIGADRWTQVAAGRRRQLAWFCRYQSWYTQLALPGQDFVERLRNATREQLHPLKRQWPTGPIIAITWVVGATGKIVARSRGLQASPLPGSQPLGVSLGQQDTASCGRLCTAMHTWLTTQNHHTTQATGQPPVDARDHYYYYYYCPCMPPGLDCNYRTTGPPDLTG